MKYGLKNSTVFSTVLFFSWYFKRGEIASNFLNSLSLDNEFKKLEAHAKKNPTEAGLSFYFRINVIQNQLNF